MEWKLAEAKNKFSEIVNKALLEGPQKILRRKESVMVISEKEYQEITGKKKSLKVHLFNGPDFEDLDFSRDRSSMRKTDL